MDEKGLITGNKNDIRALAVDGLIFGLLSSLGMVLVMASMAVLTGNPVKILLEHFGIGDLTSPIQGLLSHLAVSAIYGLLFGVLIWPVLWRFSSENWMGWLGGLVYAFLLLFLAQAAILPGLDFPLAQLPLWQWVLGHAIYGFVLGGLFSRKGM